MKNLENEEPHEKRVAFVWHVDPFDQDEKVTLMLKRSITGWIIVMNNIWSRSKIAASKVILTRFSSTGGAAGRRCGSSCHCHSRDAGFGRQ